MSATHDTYGDEGNGPLDMLDAQAEELRKQAARERVEEMERGDRIRARILDEIEGRYCPPDYDPATDGDYMSWLVAHNID